MAGSGAGASHEFCATIAVQRPLLDVFAFFSDAGNLEAITPPWVGFHILTPRPMEMRQGATIDYRIRLYGIPLKWRSLISVWEPPNRFVDEQVRGPYSEWVHEHRFEETAAGVVVTDHVRYRVPGGRVLGGLVNRLMVRRDLERIFAFRQRRLGELLGPG